MALPPGLREFDDTVSTRKNIYDMGFKAIAARFPIEDDEYRVDLVDPRYDGPQDFGLNEQKKALLTSQYLKTPIKGKLMLTHKPTNTLIEEREEVIANVPFYSDRGTVVHNGSEYSLISQSRLRPGVYTRKKRSGEIETQFNVEPGKGRGFRMFMDPTTGVFKLNIGQSAIPAYPLLKSMGATDQEMENHWGKDMWKINSGVRTAGALKKIYDRMAGYKADPLATELQMEQYLKDELPKFALDPKVVERTMGLKNQSGVDRALLLRATQRMLNVSRGEEDEDDRDAPQFKTYLGPEDWLSERVTKDAGRLTKNLLFKIRRAKSLKPFQRGLMSKYFEDPLNGSGLASPLEESNPTHYLEQMNRVTGFGEGGIGSSDAVTDEARDINANQAGFIDPVSGPESEKIGVDARFSYQTYKGNDGNIYAKFLNPKTGKEEFLTPSDTAASTIGFPGAQNSKDKYVVAIQKGKTVKVPRDQVDYVIPSLAHMFSQGVNLNNMPTSMQAGRQFYAAKFTTQFLPLKESEAPLVDTLMPDGKQTFREYYGKKSGTLNSPVDGTVVDVDDDQITVQDAEGNVKKIDAVKNFPFNRLSGISYFPVVEKGQQINKGDMLARSNFTDKNGSINLGRNLKVAMIPARGESHDDAVVLSESASRKLATERMYGFDLEAKHGIEMGRDKYMSLFPKQFTLDQYKSLDDLGVAKPGTVLKKGDPIIVGIGPKLMTAADAQLGRLHKTLRNTFTDKAVTWEHDYEGQVVDAVARGGRAVAVNVVCAPPLAEGDKVSSDFAVKGVVNKIIPDDKMPQDQATGEPYEILFNPMSILSRVSPNQIISMALAKVAKKTGQQVRIPQDAPEEGWTAWAQNLLKEHGIKDTADIFDPESGKTIKDIGDGYTYVHAFHHLSEKKLSARGGGGGYDISEQPAKGGFEGAKRFSGLDLGAALGHGVPHVIKDALGIRGTKNEEFWKTLRAGNPLPTPQVPFIYTKFLNTMRAGGVNVIENGSKTKILPMTDRDVDKLAPNEINSSDMLDDDFKPRPGGLFDAGLTGGTDGLKFTHIKLDDTVPNPIMEEPIRRILGLRVKDMEAVLSGDQQLNGKTGGLALREALAGIDTDKLMEQSKKDIQLKRGASRDNAIKVLAYLDSAKKNNIQLTDWMVSKIPVLPPKFRPIARMGNMALTADMNELYRDLLETRNNLREVETSATGASGEDRINIYNAVKAVYGLGDPITPEGQSKHLKGALWQVVGDRPKSGMFQRQVMSKTVDNVSRGVITPDPNLDMDTIGIPEDAAWESYKDFAIRRLSRKGYPMIKAMQMVQDRDPVAKAALTEEMADRPVIVDRAPTWHKFNLMAFYPVLSEGKSIRLSPLAGKLYNADFDGDTMSMHVPVSDKAVDEAKRKMLPSSNLFTATSMRDPGYTPKMEMTLGLYQLTREPSNKPVKKFANAREAKLAYKRGELAANDPIEIG